MTEWEDRDLTRDLASHICKRIYIQNNVNLGMLGEQWKGNAKKVQNAIYFEFGIGVGAGILVNNSILLGGKGTAGEIAFARFDAEPRQEFFKNMGAFEQIVSTRAILSDYAELKSGLIPKEPIEAVTLIFDRYDSGELAAKTVIGKVLDIVARAFISLSATLNPDVVILGGGMGDCLMRHINFFNEELARYVPYPPVIKPAGCRSAVVWGAVRYALDKLGTAGIIDLAKQRR
jgi:predicted NBD/HSP70 family sugar kinase